MMLIFIYNSFFLEGGNSDTGGVTSVYAVLQYNIVLKVKPQNVQVSVFILI